MDFYLEQTISESTQVCAICVFLFHLHAQICEWKTKWHSNLNKIIILLVLVMHMLCQYLMWSIELTVTVRHLNVIPSDQKVADAVLLVLQWHMPIPESIQLTLHLKVGGHCQTVSPLLMRMPCNASQLVLWRVLLYLYIFSLFIQSKSQPNYICIAYIQKSLFAS